MKKAYIQPEIELLKVSALNDFLVGSPDYAIQDGVGEGSWGEGKETDDNDFESESDDSWA